MRLLALAAPLPAISLDVDDFENEPREFTESHIRERRPYKREWLADVLTPEQEAEHGEWMADMRDRVQLRASWEEPPQGEAYAARQEAIVKMMEET